MAATLGFLYRTLKLGRSWRCSSWSTNSSKVIKLSSLSTDECENHLQAPPGRKKLKIMFFGTDDFATSSLKLLYEESLAVDGCVDSVSVTVLPMQKLTPSVTKFAKEHNLPLYHWPLDPSSVITQKFHLGVVASFGKLLPKNLISAFPLEIINVHGSLLPRWRGATPVIHALAAGDTYTGISIMKIKPAKFDVGEILAQRRLEIGPDVRRKELTAQLAKLGAQLLLEVLRDFSNYCKLAVQQQEDGVTQAPLVNLSHMACVDFSALDCGQVYNLWRAVGDLVKLRAIYQRTEVEVRFTTCLSPSILSSTNRLSEKEVSGTIKYLKMGKDKYMCVKCSKGWVAFTGIFYGKRKEMSPTDFYNGFLSKSDENRFVPLSRQYSSNQYGS